MKQRHRVLGMLAVRFCFGMGEGRRLPERIHRESAMDPTVEPGAGVGHRLDDRSGRRLAVAAAVLLADSRSLVLFVSRLCHRDVKAYRLSVALGDRDETRVLIFERLKDRLRRTP